MLDGWARKQLDPAIDRTASALADAGVSANAITFLAFAIGVAAAVAIVFGHFWLAIALILISRLGDALDGAVAARTVRTDLGGYLDIVLDFAFYGLIPLAFVINDPAANGVAGAVLLTTFYANGASFLAYSIVAEKRGLTSEARGKKSIFFTTGLAEATETIAVFVAFCLWPNWFAPIAYVFAVITVYTTLSRLILAWRQFGGGNGA